VRIHREYLIYHPAKRLIKWLLIKMSQRLGDDLQCVFVEFSRSLIINSQSCSNSMFMSIDWSNGVWGWLTINKTHIRLKRKQRFKSHIIADVKYSCQKYTAIKNTMHVSHDCDSCTCINATSDPLLQVCLITKTINVNVPAKSGNILTCTSNSQLKKINSSDSSVKYDVFFIQNQILRY